MKSGILVVPKVPRSLRNELVVSRALHEIIVHKEVHMDPNS